MKLRCVGCAGCYVDWRPLDTAAAGTDRTGDRHPLDDDLVPLALQKPPKPVASDRDDCDDREARSVGSKTVPGRPKCPDGNKMTLLLE